MLSRRMLSPPLAGGLRQLRFSPGGQYVLTQDRSGINVLSAEPLAVLFHVPAENASRAELTPDGRDIVFVRSGTHIERWSLASRTRTEFAEMPLRGPCIAERLSPDGRFLVCLDPDWTLRLIDTSSGTPILKRKNFEAFWVGESLSTSNGRPRHASESFEDFWRPPDLGTLEASMLDFPHDNQSFVEASKQAVALELSLARDLTENAALDFSPDGRFFLAVAEKWPGPVLAWDLRKNAEVHVGGALKKLNGFPYYHFTFVAGDRVLISPKLQDVKSDLMVTARLVAFPSGKTIGKVTVPAGQVTRASDRGFAIIRPSRPNLGLTAPAFQRSIASVGAYSVQLTSGVVVRNSSPGLDIFRDRYVTDNAAGDVELRSRAGDGLLASVQLPRAELGGIRAAALSGDMSRLLISSQSRAGVWNLSSGEAFVRFGPVNGADFDARGRLLLDIPETDNQQRRMVDLDTDSGGIDSGPEITAALAKQEGPYLVVVRTKDCRPPVFALDTHTYQNIIFDVLDARTMKTSWSRKFPNEAPLFFFDPSGRYCLFIWSGRADRVQHDPELRKRLSELERNLDKPPPVCSMEATSPAPAWFHERASHPTYLLKFAETIDMATGQSVGRVLFDPGDPCMRIVRALPLAHAIAIEDTHNRVITYDADSEKPRTRVFGHLVASDPVRVRIAVGKEAGRVVIYDALTGDQTDEFSFPAPLALLRFRSDGRALLAITAEQEAMTMSIR